jgi:hypothetical protein
MSENIDHETRAPSAWQLEHAMSAVEQLRARYAADPDLLEDEMVVATALAKADAEQTAAKLLDQAIDALIWIERREAEAETLRKEMTARRDRYRDRAAQVRALIGDLMGGLEIERRRAKLATASISEGQAGLILTDEQLIPDEYWKTPERVLMRTPLKDDLEQGVVVPGAVLSNPSPVLTIRRNR